MKELYVTTTEFAALIVNCLDEQNYFKRDVAAHPEDIANAFTTIGQTIGSALEWAIKTNHQNRDKYGMMEATTLKKN